MRLSEDDLRRRLRPFLDPDEDLRHVFLARRELDHSIFSLIPWVILYRLLTGNRVVGAVTDRNVVVMPCWRWGSPRRTVWRLVAPRRVVSRYPLEKGLDPMRQGTVVFVGMSSYVVFPEFRDDEALADRELGGADR